jgi:ubiquinone/menaquinone biosynthesis C-methylase UbiE
MLDWSSYAQQYDLMADNNPAYQEILEHCLNAISTFQLKPGAILADFGAGTGNFTIAIAKRFPHIKVLHVEKNEDMIQIANLKSLNFCLKNWHVVRYDLEKDIWPTKKIDVAVSVHTLYSLKEPSKVISSICGMLSLGGYFYAADLGRMMNVRDWATFMIKHSIKKKGFFGTIALFTRTGAVRSSNRHIAKYQKNGLYWLHNLSSFISVFKSCGMEVIFQSSLFYRKYDDLIIAKKPKP